MAVTTQVRDVLTASDVQHFEQHGYVIFESPFRHEALDAVVAEFESLYRDPWDPGPVAHRDGVVYTRHPGWPDNDYHWHSIRNGWKVSDNARALALSPEILATTERLFQRKVKPFQTLNFPVGTEQAAHADSFPFQSDPPGYMCAVWLALEDIDMTNGPLVFYPGSHKLPMPSWEEIERVTGSAIRREEQENEEAYQRARNRQYAEYCKDLIVRHGLEPKHGTIKKGQALLWAPNLLHGGAPQTDRNRTRHSQVTHYFFEGCRVFTPLQVEGDHIYWHYPEWIRDPVPEYEPESLRAAIKEHVPAGANVLIATDGDEELLAVENRHTAHFPQGEAGSLFTGELNDAQAVEMLESLIAGGAEYIVFPKPKLQELEFRLLALQDRLENEYRGLLRDGAIAAIYQLNETATPDRPA